MKHSLPGPTPILLLMFTAVLAVWLGIAGPVNLSQFEKWQTLIGATITGAGVLVASWNVTRQMRLTARSKEIDRLERDIPGMRDAHYFLSRIAPAPPRQVPTPERVVKQFNILGVTEDGVASIEPITGALPATHDTLRRNVILQCSALLANATAAHRYEKWASEAKENLRMEKVQSPRFEMLKNEAAQTEARRSEYMASFQRNLKRFDDFRASIRKDIDESQARLDRLRKDLQKHIDD